MNQWNTQEQMVLRVFPNRIPEGLASKEPKEIRAELSKTRNAMAEIHSHISDEMFRKKQERSKDYER